uniref:CCN TSP1 domain-containing protein n=1 Tax=Timema poppense TaxID=170557 RepID=A0A7R9DS85_TIMPO|nr:unnamed protein product [Timema poppensis]
MCDSASAQHPPDCQQQFSPWSPCSSRCGLGLSHRISNINPQCLPTNESRLCQVRPCEGSGLVSLQRVRHHHVRKGHECKATQRVSSAVHLQFGPCRSRRRYHPKMCGGCQCCRPQLSTTIRVEFYCRVGDTPRDTILDLAEPGSDLWDDSDDFPKAQSLLHSPPWRLSDNRRRLFSGSFSGEEHSVSFDVEWILKCRCSESCDEDTTGGTTPRNLEGEVILHRVHRTAAP